MKVEPLTIVDARLAIFVSHMSLQQVCRQHLRSISLRGRLERYVGHATDPHLSSKTKHRERVHLLMNRPGHNDDSPT